jgi:hypothetical protein
VRSKKPPNICANNLLRNGQEKQLKPYKTLSKRGFPLVSCLLCLFLFIDFAPTVRNFPVDGPVDAERKPGIWTQSSMMTTKPIFAAYASTRVPDLFWSNFVTPDAEDLVADQVTVPNLFSFPISQQPKGKEIFVTSQKNEVTQFRMPSYTGVTGLIAHNFLAGQQFYRLENGQKFWVQYEGKHLQEYRVTGSYRFKKLDPPNPSSRLIDLQNKQEMSAAQVYDRFYKGEHHVTFQTCLEGDGRLDWGLFFVVGEPDLH